MCEKSDQCRGPSTCATQHYERYACNAEGTGVVIHTFTDNACANEVPELRYNTVISAPCVPTPDQGIHFECLDGIKVELKTFPGSMLCEGTPEFTLSAADGMCKPKEDCDDSDDSDDGSSCFDDCPQFATLSAGMEAAILGSNTSAMEPLCAVLD
eukprot:4633725-Pyramimonas_sp.AAC.1